MAAPIFYSNQNILSVKNFSDRMGKTKCAKENRMLNHSILTLSQLKSINPNVCLSCTVSIYLHIYPCDLAKVDW